MALRNKISLYLSYLYFVHNQSNFDDTYYSDVQGPINKEPDEKLSSQNKLQKKVLFSESTSYVFYFY